MNVDRFWVVCVGFWGKNGRNGGEDGEGKLWRERAGSGRADGWRQLFATSGCSLPFILLIITSKFLSEQGWTPNEESSPGFMSA